jgi:hypothetical protein
MMLSKFKPHKSPRPRAHPIKKSFSKKFKKIISRSAPNNQDFNENSSYKSISSGYSSSVGRLEQVRSHRDMKQVAIYVLFLIINI